ncbi:MAG: iron-sulfur cluster assembly accessory protein [Candidatus Omnitrophica bacterium]|nr:iron-sulfur cluster assembly accessory protein [Candidatus Omnitrophota bacterium]
MGIDLTDAAKIEVKRLLDRENQQDLGLRLGVQGGGCSGLSYKLNFDKSRGGDNILEMGSFRVFVDPKSFLYLNGIMLDYVDSLEEKGFKFINPNAKNTCGCGESFSV